MKLDPFLIGGASMVMNYDTPQFLKQNSEWATKAFFPTGKIGLGVDYRIRIVGSKYLVVGVEGNYYFNPHRNYTQIGIRIGYYRNKKAKKKKIN